MLNAGVKRIQTNAALKDDGKAHFDGRNKARPKFPD
jgi:hypothetical protein